MPGEREGGSHSSTHNVSRQAKYFSKLFFASGFLNAMDNSVEECSAWSICEAGREASERGQVGGVVARYVLPPSLPPFCDSLILRRSKIACAAQGVRSPGCKMVERVNSD